MTKINHGGTGSGIARPSFNCRLTRPQGTFVTAESSITVRDQKKEATRARQSLDKAVGTMLISLGMSVVGGAHAQTFLPQTTLGSVPGFTELQQRTGDAVQTVCVQFIENAPEVGTPQVDLFDKCGEMVHTANELTNPDGPTAKSLGISEEQLGAALQNVAAEEAATVGTMATETSSAQGANVAARIGALKSGAGGISLSGLRFYDGGQLLGTDELASLYTKYPQGGGAAADDASPGRLGVFVNGNIGTGEKDTTNGEAGFDFDTWGITAGVDYRFTDQFVFGGALGLNNLEVDFDKGANVSGGDIDSDGYTLSAYGLYYLDNFSIDGILSFGTDEADITRRIVIPSNTGSPDDGADRTATADADSDQLSISVTASYDIAQGSLTYAPYGRLSYVDVDVDGYTEQGAQGLNLAVDSQDIESLTTAIGARVSANISRSFGVLVPQGRLEWIHEFEDDSREIISRYVNDPRNNSLIAVTDDPDEDYFSLGLSLSTVYQGGTQAFVDFETVLGLEDIEEYVLSAGARFEF